MISELAPGPNHEIKLSYTKEHQLRVFVQSQRNKRFALSFSDCVLSR